MTRSFLTMIEQGMDIRLIAKRQYISHISRARQPIMPRYASIDDLGDCDVIYPGKAMVIAGIESPGMNIRGKCPVWNRANSGRLDIRYSFQSCGSGG